MSEFLLVERDVARVEPCQGNASPVAVFPGKARKNQLGSVKREL